MDARLLTIILTLFLWASGAKAQATDELTEGGVVSVLDDSPFASARASSMAGALSTLADGVHATYYNPAGIGGLHWGKEKLTNPRQFYFPYVGVSANNNTIELVKDFRKAGASSDKAIGEALVDANAGNRQYGRLSALVGLGIGRLYFLQSTDIQIAAVKRTGVAENEGSIQAEYLRQSGSGLGFSATDPKGRFYIGAFSSFNSQQRFIGSFDYLEISNITDRVQLISDNSASYSGISTNVGMIWVLSDKGRPAIGIVARDVGDTKYKGTDIPESASENQAASYNKKEDLSVGFSISPPVGKQGAFNLLLEGGKLTNYDIALAKKLKAGLELNLGGFGSEANFGLRTGFSQAGVSGGLSLNVGLVQIEAASLAVDIGSENNSVVERRNVAILSINVTN
ncbi:MAG: hypothetical protein HYW48_07065 [Deltaproteobacteria bacterium]|nr:hypothetical protein [Deltaproteobacteria bacterium]